MEYPIFRKLSNNKAFYRINSERSFDEIQRIGSKTVRYSFQVDQYPDLLKIQDMINCSFAYEEATEEQFQSLLND